MRQGIIANWFLFQDRKQSDDLRNVLVTYDVYEPYKEQEDRVSVLQQLNCLAEQWILDLQNQSEVCCTALVLVYQEFSNQFFS